MNSKLVLLQSYKMLIVAWIADYRLSYTMEWRPRERPRQRSHSKASPREGSETCRGTHTRRALDRLRFGRARA